jgi:hypothetical protein
VRQPGVRFDDLPPIAYALLSHNHYDHCDLETPGVAAPRSSAHRDTAGKRDAAAIGRRDSDAEPTGGSACQLKCQPCGCADARPGRHPWTRDRDHRDPGAAFSARTPFDRIARCGAAS